MERKQYQECIANLTQAVQTLLNENAALAAKYKETLRHEGEMDKNITEIETKLEKLREKLKP